MRNFAFILVFIIFNLFNLSAKSQIFKNYEDPLQFKSRIINLDTIKSDTAIKKTFNFKNIGKDTIKLEGVDKSCTCTDIIISSKTKKLMPGKQGKVTMIVNLNNKKGKFMEWGVIIANTKQKYYKISLRGIISNDK